MLVVPVYNMILAPDATLYFQTEQLRRSAGGKGVAVNEKVVLIVAKENGSFTELREDGFYPVGVRRGYYSSPKEDAVLLDKDL